MSDYISREDAIRWVKTECNPYGKPTLDYESGIRVMVHLKHMPSADVVQVVHGRWENYSPITIKCSRCGHVIHDWRYSECKYCPNCGAKMDARGEE